MIRLWALGIGLWGEIVGSRTVIWKCVVVVSQKEREVEFEKLKVWQLGMLITEKVYRAFYGCRDYGLADQVRRSAVSIPSNIAEGFERDTDRDAVRFFYYAKGSAGELFTQIKIAARLGYIAADEAEMLVKEVSKLSAMLASLIRYRSA